jgi:hypothetical protein
MHDQEFSDHVAALSRRRFAGGAIAAAAAALLPAAAVADNGKVQDSGTDPGPMPEGFSVADWDEVRTRYSNLLRVYGKRLSLEEKRRAVRILTTNQRMLASIRLFVVQNGDPSACTLRVYDPKQQASAAERI